MTRIRIQTTSRLHFGLFGWGKGSPRQFGGLGLMVERPGITLIGKPAEAPLAEGPLAERVRLLLDELPERCSELGLARPNGSVDLKVLDAPDEHVGLGVGTQLSLAVTLAFLELTGAKPSPHDRTALARLSGRGIRSGIGIHGFFEGGLVVDGGHRKPGDVPPLLARHPFPDDWHILLIQPPQKGLHGAAERRAFARLPSVPEQVTDQLCRMVLLDLLPCLAERDLDGFGQALSELQRRVGTCFSTVQGGLYASTFASEIVAELGRLSLKGAGQSSWGPTLYAFSDAEESMRSELALRIRERFELPAGCVVWTRAANHGASIELESDPA